MNYFFQRKYQVFYFFHIRWSINKAKDKFYKIHLSQKNMNILKIKHNWWYFFEKKELLSWNDCLLCVLFPIHDLDIIIYRGDSAATKAYPSKGKGIMAFWCTDLCTPSVLSCAGNVQLKQVRTKVCVLADWGKEGVECPRIAAASAANPLSKPPPSNSFFMPRGLTNRYLSSADIYPVYGYYISDR